MATGTAVLRAAALILSGNCARKHNHFAQLPVSFQAEARDQKEVVSSLQMAVQRVIAGREKVIFLSGKPLPAEKDVKAVLKKVNDCVKQCEAVAKAMGLGRC